MPAGLETNHGRHPQEVSRINVAERLPTIRTFMQRPELDELSTSEQHVIGQAIGHFLLKGTIDSAALHTSAQQNIQRRIGHGSIQIIDEEGLRQDIKTTISTLGEKGLLALNEDQSTYSLGLESSAQNRGNLH